MKPERAGDPDRFLRLVRQYDGLRQVIEEISSELELRPLLTSIVRHACELLDARDGSIGLYDERREVFRTEAIYRMPLAELGREMRSGVGLAGLVLLRRAPVLLDRYDQVPLPVLPMLPELAANAVLGMPIFWRDRLIGFFGIGAPPPRTFDEKDVEILGLFSEETDFSVVGEAKDGEEAVALALDLSPHAEAQRHLMRRVAARPAATGCCRRRPKERGALPEPLAAPIQFAPYSSPGDLR